MTPPLPPVSERAIQATGARRRRPGAPSVSEVVQILRRLGAESPGLVAAVDADAVVGERHLLSAWAHLGRARARGESRLRDRNAEFLLFLAGDDQLPRALEKVGVRATTERFVVLAEKPRPLETVLQALALDPDPSAYPVPATPAALDRLGIGAADRSAVTAES